VTACFLGLALTTPLDLLGGTREWESDAGRTKAAKSWINHINETAGWEGSLKEREGLFAVIVLDLEQCGGGGTIRTYPDGLRLPNFKLRSG